MTKGYPHLQPFCINGSKNKTKKKSWWQHQPFHNNKGKKKNDTE